MSRRRRPRPARPLRKGWFREVRRLGRRLFWDVLRSYVRRPSRSGERVASDADERRARLARMGTKVATGMTGARLRTVGRSAERKREVLGKAVMRSTAEVLDTLGDMKGAVMKIAQMASFAFDGLPEPVQRQLATLQTAAPPMAYELVEQVVEAELGGPPGAVFATFEHAPMAAASIGQVHKARTRDGREVAVKVQYPGVDEAILADLRNADMIFSTVAAMFGGFDARALLEEVVARMSDEFDYRREAANQQWFADRYRGHPYVKIPEVVPELSSERVLTSEFVAGRGFYDVLDESQDVRDRYGEIIYRFANTSIYVDGIFSGDPHPGNYIFCPDGRICFLDFGLVKRLEPDELEVLRAPGRALMDRDPDALLRTTRGLGVIGPDVEVDADELFAFYDAIAFATARDEVFRFTRRKVGEMLERMMAPDSAMGKLQQQLELPPMLAIFNRYNLGTYAVLGHLEAEANWHRISREGIYDEPPSTEIGRRWGTAVDAS